MRARTLIVWASFIFLAVLVPLSNALAATVSDPFIYDVHLTRMPAIPGAPHGTYQTALRSGDAPILELSVYSKKGTPPNVSADLSTFGLSSTATTTGKNQGPEAPYTPSYFYDFGPLSVGPDISDGPQSVPITATDSAGAATTSTAVITVDNTPPEVSLTKVVFSATPPAQGDYMYLSGSIRDATSGAHFLRANVDLLDKEGNLIARSQPSFSISYSHDYLDGALASSTDGSFSNFPVPLFERVPGWIASADSFRVDLAAYDGAGNMATSSLTVPVPKEQPVSSVLFIPGTEASRLYMRNDIGEHQLWEPDFAPDVADLAMNPDGTSVNQVYTKDIIGTFYGNDAVRSAYMQSTFGEDAMVYSDFENYMNALVASTTIHMNEWRPYPYDWRYDPIDVVNNGTLTEEPDGSLKQVYLEDVVGQMASSSATGKVTIVAHSNGGLVAKALIEKLQADGKAGLVDQLIMLGTPQWGTPSAIGAMEHTDNFSDIPNFVINKTEARSAESGMGDPYALLPSPAYFSHVADPVVTFDSGGLLTGTFAAAFGPAIGSFSNLLSFLTNAAGLDSQTGDASNLRALVPLSGPLMEKAETTHASLDAWTPPPGVAVTAIAGWGQDTTKTLAYTTGSKVVCADSGVFGFRQSGCADTPELEHTAVTTQDGDGTVVSPSAIGSVGQSLYFNTKDYNKTYKTSLQHQNLTSASSIEEMLSNFLTKISFSDQFISASTPVGSENPIKLRISSHSPVNIIVTDSNGQESGVLPIPNTDFAAIKQDISDSSAQVLDDEEYVTVPQTGSYQVIATGYAAGPTTLQLETVDSDGLASTTAVFADIPTTASSTVSFSVSDGVANTPILDVNGDGSDEITIPPVSSISDPLAYIAYMQSVTSTLALPKELSKGFDAFFRFSSRTLENAGKGRGIFKKPAYALVRLQIDLLEQLLEKDIDFGDSTHGRKHNTQTGISPEDAALILDMLNELKSLLA